MTCTVVQLLDTGMAFVAGAVDSHVVTATARDYITSLHRPHYEPNINTERTVDFNGVKVYVYNDGADNLFVLAIPDNVNNAYFDYDIISKL